MAEHPSWEVNLCPPGEPVPGKTYRADGWLYFDPPTTFTLEMWTTFLNLIGERGTDYEILIETRRTGKDGTPLARGQLTISPVGYQRLLDWQPPEKFNGGV